MPGQGSAAGPWQGSQDGNTKEVPSLGAQEEAGTPCALSTAWLPAVLTHSGPGWGGGGLGASPLLC